MPSDWGAAENFNDAVTRVPIQQNHCVDASCWVLLGLAMARMKGHKTGLVEVLQSFS